MTSTHLNSPRTRLGFRDGDKGTHTSRTVMLAELTYLLDAVPPDAERQAYRTAVVEQNVLGKKTESTRRLSFQRLSELYGLDPDNPVFRAVRRLWPLDLFGRPMIAFLAGYARDPLLRASSPPVLRAKEGQIVPKETLSEAVGAEIGDRLNPDILAKVARNASSSWTQAGFLKGRAKKVRQRIRLSWGAITMAVFLGYLEGRRGPRLLDSQWTRLFDLTGAQAADFLEQASRRGWVDFKRLGEVVEIRFPGWLTDEEEELTYGTD